MSTTTWYLEMTDPAELKPGREPGGDVRFVRAEVPSPELSRFLYEAVGRDHQWTDRDPWTDQEWRDRVEHPEVETWVLHDRGTPAGYAELEAQPEGAVEIVYFGLLPGFLGRGLGGHMLTETLRRAWTLADRRPGREPTRRVWLHTCSLDGEHALTNYESRGLRVYRKTIADEASPADRTTNG
ncbi:GNAT family N-acetyltransferase [Nocardiopsis metallicus]|uniref:GNAT superfamily N-acetyltransferase n=1 Tax=Nocardiopsis metallicus TaxID=179819 RepID=A0A840WCX8_9ACTN|nr:GNAT family N-acetyltransferase [Nocardiopsis metallicus]MBB5493994.1 GNAT superfamily N-acetyltransferase [Nocardiopsis metallicus]